MDNKDQPIHPIMNKEFIRPDDESKGLTKREHFAILALQGILANPNRGSNSDCSEAALRYADALLDLLENKK